MRLRRRLRRVPAEAAPALVAGVDEVGRGPLAGPVVAAAVVLDPRRIPEGIRDSKRLSARRREHLAAVLEEAALAIALGSASVAEIDRMNILNATFLAMRRAVAGLSLRPERILVDGARSPDFGIPCDAVVGGDGSVACIGAASIIAKVARDRELVRLASTYPGYGFAQHKGYGTRAHLDALARLGPCPQHRRSFAPVRDAIARHVEEGP